MSPASSETEIGAAVRLLESAGYAVVPASNVAGAAAAAVHHVGALQRVRLTLESLAGPIGDAGRLADAAALAACGRDVGAFVDEQLAGRLLTVVWPELVRGTSAEGVDVRAIADARIAARSAATVVTRGGRTLSLMTGGRGARSAS